jgi:hypothetical protein
MKLSLEIKDSKGNLVRKYGSESDKDFVGGYAGGPSPDQVLPTKAGVNRYIWDLRYPTQTGVQDVFIEGGYEGHRAVPGDYTAVLSDGKQSKTVSFKVLPDPRIVATAKDYEDQHILASKVEAGINEIHKSVVNMRKLNKQLSDLQGQLSDTTKYKVIREQSSKVQKTLAKWEEELVQTKSQSNDDVINYINKLSADYVFLKGELDANIPYVTNAQLERYAELDKLWQPLKKQMQDLVNNDVSEINKLCKDQAVNKIIIGL